MVTVTELNRAPDGTFESLEATGSFTDPSGIKYTGAINPVQVTEEASTFTEPDVTVTKSGAVVSSGSISLSDGIIIDDFEDGDITVDAADWSGWSGDTGSLTAQQNTVINGNYSAKLEFTNDFGNVSASRNEDVDKKLSIVIRADKDTGSSGDDFTVVLQGSGNQIGPLNFEDGNGGVTWETSSGIETVLSSWSANTNYNIEFDFDFANDVLDIIVNGTNEGTYGFRQTASGLDGVEIRNNTSNSGATRAVYFDDVIEGTEAFSGNVLVEWDSGVPADLDGYDLATFQRTLDSETVTIDVEDGNGNVLFSDISQNFDISTVDTSKEVKLRANLSRTNTSNNPTVDYLARRFNRS